MCKRGNMRRYAEYILIVLSLIFISGCSTVSDFYTEWIPIEAIPEENRLKADETPQIYYSTDIYSDIYFLRSNYFWIIGSASYNGPDNDSLDSEITDLCRENGAKIAVYTYQYTNTITGITGYRDYISSYSIDRYDYLIYFFSPMSLDESMYFARVGISCRDMNTSERMALKKNTGAYIDIVYSDSPAYNANLFPGDIITEVNGQEVPNAETYDAIINSIYGDQPIQITFIRDGITHYSELTPLF